MTPTTAKNATAPTVRIAEIAVQLTGLPELVEGYADRFGLPLVTHWDGTPGLAQHDAADLVAKVRELREEQTAREREYAAHQADRDRRRQEAGTSAYEKAVRDRADWDLAATKSAGDSVQIAPDVREIISGTTRTAARAAREQALEEFDRKNKLVSFAEFRA